jgi:hypothetical protein
LAEKYLNAHELAPEQFEALLKAVLSLIPNFNDLTIQARQLANLPLQPESTTQDTPSEEVNQLT